MSNPTSAAGGEGAVASSPAVEKFLVLPVIILILAQMGTTGDNGALSLAASALTSDLGATTSDIQLANMIYPLVGGAFMIAGGLLGTILGWARTFRAGAVVCAAGEVALALAPNMAVFIWVGRVLVGLGASLSSPRSSGSSPCSTAVATAWSPSAASARRPGCPPCCRSCWAWSWRAPG